MSYSREDAIELLEAYLELVDDVTLSVSVISLLADLQGWKVVNHVKLPQTMREIMDDAEMGFTGKLLETLEKKENK